MKLNVCTWNLLNPEPTISFMSWKGWICQFRKNCDLAQAVGTKSSPSPYTIASIDYERFVNFRSQAIINILSWMISKSPQPLIINLQEVHPLLLSKLKNLVSPTQIVVGQETQSNYLVTIVTQGHITTSKSIFLDKKIALVSKIKFPNLDQEISCANIHFYWKWSSTQVKTFGQELVSNLDTPFVIAGDFNKPIDMLEEFMDLTDCILYNDLTKSKPQPYTSVLTHKPDELPELGQIDHIMFSSEFVVGSTTKYKILSKLLGYKIFYSFAKLIELFESNKISNYSKWVNLRPGSDISDHKPVFVKNIEISNSLV